MPELRTIEIDFDIHKLIEAERQGFSETPNAVLRRLLGLSEREPEDQLRQSSRGGRSWAGEGVTLPHGTEIRMTYNGRRYEGCIVDGKWEVDGKTFDSPSGAASGIALTKRGKRTRLDGWNYWEARLPADARWMHISSLRSKAKGIENLTAEDLGL